MQCPFLLLGHTFGPSSDDLGELWLAPSMPLHPAQVLQVHTPEAESELPVAKERGSWKKCWGFPCVCWSKGGMKAQRHDSRLLGPSPRTQVL